MEKFDKLVESVLTEKTISLNKFMTDWFGKDWYLSKSFLASMLHDSLLDPNSPPHNRQFVGETGSAEHWADVLMKAKDKVKLINDYTIEVNGNTLEFESE
jgi:hypothetical protein